MKPKVLVAEDNVDHLELLSDALSDENIVVGTDSKQGCMDYLENDQFDLVVLDYNLKKDFSGFDILREITLKYPYLPVIMVTAYGNEELAVKVMKIGAKDYIRKTLDNNYIDRIVTNVRTLVTKKDKREYIDVKSNALSFLEKNKEVFIAKWKEKIHIYEEKFDIPGTMNIPEHYFYKLYGAFLDDLGGDKVSQTLDILMEIFNDLEKDERLLINIELLNVSFREITHNLLLKEFPDFFDYGSTIMDQISWIVDANDLLLSKEYEKVIDRSVEDVRKMEHFKANETLIIQLRHKLDESLKHIGDNTKKMMNDPSYTKKDELKTITNHLQQIESVLYNYEKESRDNLETYRKKIKKYR
ncbi:MAG: response regulator [Spirochaetales bacterium]|nr:response regulator [Spirochaetales bacterium]